MADLGTCIGMVAPYYNLVLVIIIVPLFIKLLNLKSKKINLAPWTLLFAALAIYIVEEVLTVLNSLGVILTPRVLTSIFEMAIITLFIYLLLLQKEIVKK